MFGGYGSFLERRTFCLIAQDDLFFKVDDVNCDDYEAAGSGTLSFEGKSKLIEMS